MLCRVAVLCKRRIMLTGTPLQNDLQELQNLLEFLLPDIFHEESAAELSAVQVRPNLAWCLKRHSTVYSQLMAGELAKACDAAGLLHALSCQGVHCRHAWRSSFTIREKRTYMPEGEFMRAG